MGPVTANPAPSRLPKRGSNEDLAWVPGRCVPGRTECEAHCRGAADLDTFAGAGLREQQRARSVGTVMIVPMGEGERLAINIYRPKGATGWDARLLLFFGMASRNRRAKPSGEGGDGGRRRDRKGPALLKAGQLAHRQRAAEPVFRLALRGRSARSDAAARQ